MANYYSSLYDLAPYRGQVSYLGRQPQESARGFAFTEFFTFNIPTGTVLATNDIIHLMPLPPAGVRVTRFAATLPGYDGGATLTANFGFLSQALGVGIVTGLTVATLRTGGTFGAQTTPTDATLLAGSVSSAPVAVTTNLLAAGASDELIIFISAGAASAGTNGTSQVLIEGCYP